MSFLMRTSTVYIVTATRSGMASLIAMIYLTIFTTMAVGFYATTNTNAIVATNEMQSTLALGSAESGMDFMRYQLSGIVLPYGTNPANLLTNASNVLGASLNGTANMGDAPSTLEALVSRLAGLVP